MRLAWTVVDAELPAFRLARFRGSTHDEEEPMSDTETRLITIVEAAEIVGLSRSKLYELLASRELPSVRIGRSRRIDLADLERFIERHRVPQRPDVAFTPDARTLNAEVSR